MFLLLVLTFPLVLFALLLGMERVEQPLRGERPRGAVLEGQLSLVARQHARSAERYRRRQAPAPDAPPLRSAPDLRPAAERP